MAAAHRSLLWYQVRCVYCVLLHIVFVLTLLQGTVLHTDVERVMQQSKLKPVQLKA